MGRGGMSEKISLGCSHLSSSFPPYVHPASQLLEPIARKDSGASSEVIQR